MANGNHDKALQQLLEMNLDIKGSKAEIDLLWQNASPASAFAAQTLQIDFSAYGLVLIITTYRQEIITIRGLTGSVYRNVGLGGQARVFNVASSSIAIGNGEEITSSAQGWQRNNNVLCPLYIYGIKI